MKTKRLFTKWKLLIALSAFILVSCNLDESTKFVGQEHTDINTTESVYAQIQ